MTGIIGRFLCAIGLHPCTTNSDDDGVWGECIRCHRRFGYVDRAALRRYADAEYEAVHTPLIADLCGPMGRGR